MRLSTGCLAALCLVLAACAERPLPSAFPLVGEDSVSVQRKLERAQHWEIVANDTAKKIIAALGKTPDLDPSGPAMSDSAPYLIRRPIYLQSANQPSAFVGTFHSFLTEKLLASGHTVTRTRQGAVVVNYDVRVLNYNGGSLNRSLPGTFTLVAPMAMLGYEAIEDWGRGSGHLAGVGLGVIADAMSLLSMDTNAEVVITTRIFDRNTQLAQTSQIYYIDNRDMHLYADSSTPPGMIHAARPAPAVSTGPMVSVPTQTRTVRLVAQ